MIVNQLAKAVGVEPHVVRYYTRIGLLHPVRHPDNGYKLYQRSDIHRLDWIRRAQELGFSLTEIAAMLDAKEHGAPCRARLHDGLRSNIERNRGRLAELQELQARMEAALREWDRADAGPAYDLAVAPVEEASPEQPPALRRGLRR